MELNFYKYQGTGNDFVILDNRDGRYSSLNSSQVAFLCHRRFGIGADGLMMLNSNEHYDFEMKYFNSDGPEGSMCGNGGRCLVKFAYHLGISSENFHFIAVDGPHEAKVNEQGLVSLKMQDVQGITRIGEDSLLNTGSPHYIKNVNDLQHFDVFKEGRAIRYNETFSKDGVNVNFVEPIERDSISVRTYERGVEDETYSCGTGVTAAAIAIFGSNDSVRHVRILTKGGELSVDFCGLHNEFNNIWLNGPAELVFEGKITL